MSDERRFENRDCKILIVDDQPKNIQVLGNILMEREYNLTFASNGEDALKIASENELDLILLDVMMPGIDGFETCRRLKGDEKTAEVPVIFMTALADTSDKITGFKAGAVDYVTKPYEAEEITARVETHLTIRKLEQNLRKRVDELEIRNNFIRRTFGRYLSDDIVESLLEHPEGVRMGGEKRVVSILMSDLRGFSSVTEHMRPEQVVAYLNNYLGVMTDVILKYDGTIDEFIGDAILVIFGAPIWKDDHAERAAACAADMQLAMTRFNEANREQGLPEAWMGVAVNTGEVIVGNIGSMKRAKYGVVGRNVNITSRIESYTVGGQILVSEGAYQAVKDKAIIKKSIKVNPKGVRRPIELYDLAGMKEPYNLRVPTFEEPLVALKEPLALSYVELDEKSADHVAFEGRMMEVSKRRALVELKRATTAFTNLKITLHDHDSEAIYAKVVETLENDGTCVVHFTYMPDDVKRRVADLVSGKQNGGADA
ncbi:MAG: response regulator [Ignavibacteriales bacterium]|nr:response regulator [Ignavibacteriales bacterium]